MQIHSLVQGSDAWHQFRATHFGASEAAAMLGLSTKVKRTELLHMKHTGSAKEFGDWVQKNIMDYGHEVEAMARPLIEQVIGEDLYPVTCSLGDLSASCDGLTMGEDIVFEHKQWNKDLAALVVAGVVPDDHMPQCQQLLLVTGARKVIFTVSDGTNDRLVYAEVEPSQDWFERIRAGWEQFQKDLTDYTPVQYAEAPRPAAIMQLPALAVMIRGEVVQSNLPAFREAATKFIANIKTELETDEDFANAAATVQFCEKAEKDLELTRSSALGQTASIDELMKTIDFIQSELRTKRLALDKLVTTKKASIKEGAIVAAKATYAAHIESLEADITPVKLALNPAPDLAGAAKNKRTLASLHDALNTELANAKIRLEAIAKAARTNLAYFKEHASEHKFLFVDIGVIATKEYEDFTLLVRARIDHYIQSENDRVRAEEDAKASAAVAISHASQPRQSIIETVGSSFSPAARSVRPSSSAPPALRLGQIVERLGFVVTAEFLRTLGFDAAGRERAAVLFHEADFGRMCTALITHIGSVQKKVNSPQ